MVSGLMRTDSECFVVDEFPADSGQAATQASTGGYWSGCTIVNHKKEEGEKQQA